MRYFYTVTPNVSVEWQATFNCFSMPTRRCLWMIGCFVLLVSGMASAQTSYNRWDARPPAAVAKPVKSAAIAVEKDTATSVVLKTPEGKTMTVVCLPNFPGGQWAFDSYVSKKLKKPKGPRQHGTVQVTLTVLASGVATGMHIKPGDGLSPAYDAALLEAMSAMPKFSPGGCNGNSKAMDTTLSYQFK